MDFRVLWTFPAHDFDVRTKTVLITGFEPFGGENVNPSQEIARILHGKVISGRTVVGAVLPCVFGASRRELNRLCGESSPSWSSEWVRPVGGRRSPRNGSQSTWT